MKILEILESFSIFWLPILACYIAQLLTKIITAEMIIRFFELVGVLCILMLIIINRKERAYEKRTIRKNRLSRQRNF